MSVLKVENASEMVSFGCGEFSGRPSSSSRDEPPEGRTRRADGVPASNGTMRLRGRAPDKSAPPPPAGVL